MRIVFARYLHQKRFGRDQDGPRARIASRAEPVRQPKTPPPTISVVICAYTDERLELLAAGIESLRTQTVAPHELVLVIDHAPELEAIARERWPEAKVVANREQQGLSGARNTGVAECSGEVVAFLDDDAAPAPNWIERLGAAYADPNVLGAGGTVRPNWETERPGWFPPEFDWVVGCTHSGMPQRAPGGPQPGRRQHVLPPRRPCSRPAASATSSAGSARSRPAPRRPTSRSGSASTTPAARSSTTPRPRSTTSSRPSAPASSTSPRAAAARAARRRSSPASSAATTASPKSAPTPAAPCRSASCTASATPSAATSTASRGRRCWSSASAPRPRGYLGGQGEAKRLSRRRELAAAPRASALRVLMVTPRSPLLQGGVERHVMETSKRVAATGAEVEVLCTEPGGPAVAEQSRDGVHDPHRPLLARRPRLVPGAAALARDVAPALGRRPRPELPHAGRAAGDAAGADPGHPLCSHLPRRRPLPGPPQRRPRRPAPAAGTAAAPRRPPRRRRPLRGRGVRRRARPAGGEVRPDPERDRPRLRRRPAPRRAATAPPRSPRSAGSSATRATTA